MVVNISINMAQTYTTNDGREMCTVTYDTDIDMHTPDSVRVAHSAATALERHLADRGCEPTPPTTIANGITGIWQVMIEHYDYLPEPFSLEV